MFNESDLIRVQLEQYPDSKIVDVREAHEWLEDESWHYAGVNLPQIGIRWFSDAERMGSIFYLCGFDKETGTYQFRGARYGLEPNEYFS